MPAAPPLRRLTRPGLPFWHVAVIVGLALAARVLYVWQIRRTPFFDVLMGDSKSYDDWARTIAGGEWVGRDVFYQAPLYPYFLGAIYSLVGHSVLAVRLVQCALGAIACGLMAAATARLFSARAGLVAGLGLAMYAPALFFDGLLQKTSLDGFLTCLVVWIASRLTDERLSAAATARRWLALGVSLGLLSLTRENALVLVVVFAVWCLWPSMAQFSTRLKHIGAMAAGLLLVLAPVVARNALVGGGFYLTTSQFGPNLYLGNNAFTDGTAGSLIAGRGSAEFERQDAVDLAEQAVGRALSPAEVSDYWTQQTLSFIRTQPTAWVRLMGRKTLLLWNRAEAFDTESQESYADWAPWLRALAAVGHFGVLIPLAAVGIVVTASQWRRLLWLYLLIVVYAASVVAFFIYARYRFALVPMVMPFAAAALTQGAPWWHHSRPRARVALASVATLVLAVTWWPMLDARANRAVTEHNLGAALQSAGRLNDAIAHYRQAIAINAAYPPAHSNLGTALAAQGDIRGAIAAYARALTLDATFADARFNLGNAYLELGDAASALPHFRQLAERTPNAPDVLTNFGIALAATGRHDEAVAVLDHAVRLAPKAAAPRRALGDVLAAAGQRDAALEALRQAVALDPLDGRAQGSLGRVLLESGRTEEAIAALRVATERPPVTADAFNDLAVALASTGRTAEAAPLFKRALELQPDFEEARENLRRIEELRN